MQTTNNQTGDTVKGTSTGKTTSTYYTYSNPSYSAEKGWECPRCGRINAPWVRQCDCNGNNWSITWKDDTTAGDEWWKKYVTCDSDTFKIHPDDITYTTAHNSTVGGSDYWDEVNKIWTNIPNVSNNVTREDSPWNKYFTLTSDKINELQTQINSLKETK